MSNNQKPQAERPQRPVCLMCHGRGWALVIANPEVMAQDLEPGAAAEALELVQVSCPGCMETILASFLVAMRMKDKAEQLMNRSAGVCYQEMERVRTLVHGYEAAQQADAEAVVTVEAPSGVYRVQGGIIVGHEPSERTDADG